MLPRGLQIASFVFHDVCDDPSESGFQRRSAVPYKLSRQAFGQALEAFGAGRTQPSLVTAVDFTRPARHMILTFDDGGSSASYISEALAARGWKAHFFVTTGLIGAKTFLDAAAIREIAAAGHLVGSHSNSHPGIFKAQPPGGMLEEWRVCCGRVAQSLGCPWRAASVPGGDISRTVLRSADAAGLKYLFTSEPRLKPEREGGCWVLGRVCPKSGMPAHRYRTLSQFEGWARESAIRRGKVFLHTALAPV